MGYFEETGGLLLFDFDVFLLDILRGETDEEVL